MSAGEHTQGQSIATSDLEGACPLCAEPVPTIGPPPGCPFHGEAGCPIASHGDGHRLDETIAYRGDQAEAPEPHGFPEVDDLAHRPLGQYRLGPAIGHGSMGRVYRAEHAGLGRSCAIKVLSPGLVARQPQTVERFWAEARAVAGLVHPNVVTVHNLGSDRGYHYIEMEYVPGGVTLKEKLVRDGAFDPLQATTLVRQVALGLGAAHRSGLVHRDVKPSNVLLTAEGKAKLADFGLVRRLDDGDMAGAPLAGTPTFMAPELFAGAAPSPRADLYAVGIMFFYLLTTRLPFASDRISHLIRLHRRATIPDVRRLVPSVPEEVAAVLGRLLAKEPADRPESADALAEDLKVILGHLRDTDSLIHEGIEGLGGFVQGGRDRYRIIVPVPGDRLQEVYIEVVEGRKRQRLLVVYSVCAPAHASNYEFALRLNSELTIGALSIREVNGDPMFVMTRTYALGHVTAADIRAAVCEIARRGDWVEQQLTHTDVF